MLNVYKTSLRAARKINSIINPETSNFGRNWKMFPNKEYASMLIYDELISDKPSMIARLGATEMLCLTNYLGVNKIEFKNSKGFIEGKTPPWWWAKSTIEQMQSQSGFFPGTIEKIEKFCKLMFADMLEVDILGSWLKEENFFRNELSGSKKVMLEDLEPFFTSHPWTKALEKKKVLVVHPFTETIQQQYKLRSKLFDNDLLPSFELLTVKAVQTSAKEKSEFEDWFRALEFMKREIDNKDFDICILGCGAYGFPLAAHIKRMGKKSIHLGGVTQLLFGIKGKRWENYLFYPYQNLFNDYWVRPNLTDTPTSANVLEEACYW